MTGRRGKGFARAAALMVAAAATPAAAESARLDPPGRDSIWRFGMRGVLFVPRVAADAALSPVNLTAWAYDRYHLDQRCYRVFFHDARIIGLVPTAAAHPLGPAAVVCPDPAGHACTAALPPADYAILRIATARPGFDGQTFVHVARDPATGALRVVGIWRS